MFTLRMCRNYLHSMIMTYNRTSIMPFQSVTRKTYLLTISSNETYISTFAFADYASPRRHYTLTYL